MKKQILLASLLSALSFPAMADGFYILGDIGQSNADYEALDGYSLEKDDTTYSIGAGFDLNQFASIEVTYRDLGSFNDRGNDGFDSWSDTLSVTALQASIVGRLPVNDVFNVYGRLGFANIDAELDISDNTGLPDEQESDSKTRGLFGIGASYNLTPEFALNAEYSQYAKWDDLKLSALTVGATYHF
ncbi:MAG: hypothetical protein EOO52_16105 [Gammaproteobacteria bacterium]|nr:MAG: hypothetical protein EOO52_16105 [Gammaproteobacteria bacterium]